MEINNIFKYSFWEIQLVVLNWINLKIIRWLKLIKIVKALEKLLRIIE